MEREGSSFSDFANNPEPQADIVSIENEDEEVVSVSYQDAENAVLGIFMQDDDCASLIVKSGLTEEHFSLKRNRIIFPILTNVRMTRRVCTYELVVDEIEKQDPMPDGTQVIDYIGGPATIMKLLHAAEGIISLQITEEYVKLVFERYRLNKFKDAASKIQTTKRFDETKLIEVVSQMQNVLLDNTLSTHGLVRLDTLLADAYDRFKDRKENPIKYKGVKSGFYWLDKNDAICKQKLTVLGAKTNIGKSIMVSNMVTNFILNGDKVLVFTPEMTKGQYIDRLVCAEAGVSIDDWKKALVTNHELKKIANTQQMFISEVPDGLWIEDRGDQTCNFIVNSVKRHMLNHPVDVVVVDYLQTLKYFGDTRKAITDIVNKFFSFAKANNIAFIVVSQLRRTESAEPELHDLKESGDIENKADAVVLLHRNSTTKLRERNIGWYSIAKNRGGKTTDKVELNFDEVCLKFSETDPPEEDVEDFLDEATDEYENVEKNTVEGIKKHNGGFSSAT